MKRALPAIGLFFLAPLVAEFLLGNLPITLLGALIILAPMYGGGALLIREVVRRTGGGWPGIVALGVAYAIFEEAFTTQTLFNPNYLHLNLHLLDPAYIPALGDRHLVDYVCAHAACGVEHLRLRGARRGDGAGPRGQAVAGRVGAGGNRSAVSARGRPIHCHELETRPLPAHRTCSLRPPQFFAWS